MEPTKDEMPYWRRLFAGVMPLRGETGFFVFVSAMDVMLTFTLLWFSAEGGLGEAGALWGGLAAVAFVAGALVGHRLWRPAAVAVVAAVALIASWGWLL